MTALAGGEPPGADGEPFDEVHRFFGLSYANYLVLPRTLLQSMPDAWQTPFTALLEELQNAFHHIDQADAYQVRARDADGRYMTDPVPPYRRGRTRIAPRTGEPQ